MDFTNWYYLMLLLYIALAGIGIWLIQNGNKSVKEDSWYFALLLAQFYTVGLHLYDSNT
jgi:hypothetical protein